MKKKLLLTALLALTLASCNKDANPSVSIITPKGTPAIAIANYAIDHIDDVEVVAGAQPLVAAFAEEKKDVIIAPINLGALRYSAKQTYGLYKVLVWDNLYLVSRTEISSIEDLNGAKITSFGKGSTPQIVLEGALKAKNVTADITYLDNVNTANSQFVANEADIIVSAEPNVSSLNKDGIYVKSLTDFWKEATGFDTYPQSAMFVKYSKYEEIKGTLEEICDLYDDILTDVEKTAKNAAAVVGMNENLLKKALPNCGFKSVENPKELVEAYYNQMIELGLGASLGGALPNENFYELLKK